MSAERVTGFATVLQRLDALAVRTASLAGWRRHALAAALGTLATLALPPTYLLPVLYVSFTGLVWLLPAGSSRLGAFSVGWWFGMGYFLSSLYWVGFAPANYAAELWWIGPLWSLMLPLPLSIFHGAATLAASRYGDGHLRRAIMLTLAWGITEWLRGHIFTGLPWNMAGYGWVGSDALAQTASVFGMYGVTVLAVGSASILAAAANARTRIRVIAIGIAVLLPFTAWVGGAIRLAGAPALGTDTVPNVGLRLVQANIPQNEKWNGRLIERNFALQQELSVRNRPNWVTDVIWPETAAVIDLTNHSDWAQAAGAIAPAGGLLLTGTPRRQNSPRRIWNSMIAVDTKGNIAGSFDKFHLVPFGEYMPLGDILPFDKITPGRLDFSAGPGPRAVKLPGLPPVGPLICYEAIFPGEVVDPHNRPDWLLNLTNDAWYGQTAGPHQHLAITRMRAVEEGLPFVRSANTGISAVFDAWGREVARLDLNEQGTLDVKLPRPTPKNTIYGNLNDVAFLLLILLVFLSLFRLPNN
jgi:apolipoprotein N-acyltransferase